MAEHIQPATRVCYDDTRNDKPAQNGVAVAVIGSAVWFLGDQMSEPFTVPAQFCTLLPPVPPPLPERWLAVNLKSFGNADVFLSRHSLEMEARATELIVRIWTDSDGVDRAEIERVGQ